MSLSLKHLSIKMLVLIGLLASANLFACTYDNVFKNNLSGSFLSDIQVEEVDISTIATPRKSSVHKHAQMSHDSHSDSENSGSHKNCECCGGGGCASCVGCSGSCGFAAICASSNNKSTNMPLGRFVQMQAIYASVSPTPLEHPPK